MVGATGRDRLADLAIGDVAGGGEDPGNSAIDALDLFGSGGTRATTTIIVATPDHENGTVQFLDGCGNVIGRLAVSDIAAISPCTAQGTRIATATGPVPVAALRAGDRVLTRDHGDRTLRWFGRRDLMADDLVRPPQLGPVVIARGAPGAAVPSRDMPHHRSTGCCWPARDRPVGVTRSLTSSRRFPRRSRASILRRVRLRNVTRLG